MPSPSEAFISRIPWAIKDVHTAVTTTLLSMYLKFNCSEDIFLIFLITLVIKTVYPGAPAKISSGNGKYVICDQFQLTS